MRPQIGHHTGRKTSGEWRAPPTVNGTVRCKHSVLEEVKQRSLRDTEHFRVSRFGRDYTDIIAKPLDVGMAEYKVPPRFMPDKGAGRTIPAEQPVRIRVELCRTKQRQVFNSGASRLVSGADKFCHVVALLS